MSKKMEKFINEMISSGLMRDPKTYSAEELKYLNPSIPADFIDDHVAVRDGKKKTSDWQRIPVKLKDLGL